MLFDFKYITNQSDPTQGTSLFFLNEEHKIVPHSNAKRFIVKQKTPSGFKEFYGIIRDPNFLADDAHTKTYETLIEGKDPLYEEFGLDKDLDLDIEGKIIPLYFTSNFLEKSPPEFAGIKRTKEWIASNAAKRREFIANWYKEKIIPEYVKTLAEVQCCSVAELYEYLNRGKEWKIGIEYSGYVDGAWEIGGFLQVSVDTAMWDGHTFCHEISHSFSYYLIDEFFDEYFDLVSSKQEEPVTQYASIEISEDIAETGGFYFSSDYERKKLQSKCPLRYAFMEKLMKAPNYGLVKVLKPTSVLTKRFKRYDKKVY